MDVKNRFIILKKTKYGEADLILHALGAGGEKMSFIARGALKSRKRFGGGVLDPLHFVQFTYRPGAEGKLSTVKEATLISDFAGLRADYDRLSFALKILDVIGRVSQEGDTVSASVFNLLGHTLRALESTSDFECLKLQFWLKFLHQQGVLTPEPWMTPFLKSTIAEHARIGQEGRDEIRRIAGLEMLVDQYVRHATLS